MKSMRRRTLAEYIDIYGISIAITGSTGLGQLGASGREKRVSWNGTSQRAASYCGQDSQVSFVVTGEVASDSAEDSAGVTSSQAPKRAGRGCCSG